MLLRANIEPRKRVTVDQLLTEYFLSHSLALGLVESEIFTSANGNRDDATDVVIILTDGGQAIAEATFETAARIRNSGAKIFMVGFGGNVDTTAFSKIVSDEGAAPYNQSATDGLTPQTVGSAIVDNLCST